MDRKSLFPNFTIINSEAPLMVYHNSCSAWIAHFQRSRPAEASCRLSWPHNPVTFLFRSFGGLQYLDSFICTITGISLLLIDSLFILYIITCSESSKNDHSTNDHKNDNETNYYTSNNKFDQIVFIQK